MSQALIFDTLQYAKKLKEAGFTEQQAEVQAEAMANIINERLVTKNDLIVALRELEYKLVLKFGAMLVVAVGALAAIIKL